jgi:hypothetical protein
MSQLGPWSEAAARPLQIGINPKEGMR